MPEQEKKQKFADRPILDREILEQASLSYTFLLRTNPLIRKQIESPKLEGQKRDQRY